MIALILLIFILGTLIFVHEFGHFITAKKCGAHVYEFALGMGPKLFSFKRKNDPTLYSLRAFPIGGYCAIAGEIYEDDSEEVKLKPSEYMCNMGFLPRCLIMIAGVTMNFLTGIVLLFVSALIWGALDQESIIGNVPVSYTINDVQYSYPVYEAGIREGDKIIAIDGKRVNTWDKVTLLLSLKHDSETYTFKIKKVDGSIKEYKIKPADVVMEDGTTAKVFGVGQSQTRTHGVISAAKYAFLKTGTILSTMTSIIGNLIIGKLPLNSLSGPIGVYSVTKDAARQSAESVVYLMAYLSINLGFMNILPFPAFDGGRVLLLIIEKIRGKKMNPKIENMINTVGFIILIGLMIVISIKDILNLF